MSKASDQSDDLLPEYDFSSMAGGVRGKHYRRYREGVNLVLLEPDIAKVFSTDAAVNEALRKIMTAPKASRRAGLPNNRMQRTKSAKAKRRGLRR